MYRVSRDKPHRKRSEEMKEKYPVLIGHSARACKKLFTMEQVADFICEQGLYGEVTIETPEGLMLISTYGIYLDKVTDMEYRAQFLEILEPKQHALEKAEFAKSYWEENNVFTFIYVNQEKLIQIDSSFAKILGLAKENSDEAISECLSLKTYISLIYHTELPILENIF